MQEPIAFGDIVICSRRLYQVVDIDRYGFCTLADNEGESIIRHQSFAELTDPFLRALARSLAPRFEE
jgi:hypothetical protein